MTGLARLARIDRCARDLLLEARRLSGASPMGIYRRFDLSEIRVVRARFPHRPTAEIARRLGRSEAAVRGLAQRLDLRKTEAYLASPAACRLRRGDEVGKATRFRKGHVPANKGLRRPGWCAGRMSETWFRKGDRPHTWVPIGKDVVDPEGYRKRKVADDRSRPSRFNWKFVHILVWEAEHGPVPAGHAIAFKNGDRRDIRRENLELVSRRELMRRNSIHRLPRALKSVIHLRGALVRRIRRAAA